jgi:hypothetical protein
MSTRDPMAERANYIPPKQSRGGQLFDSLFILALLFVILFGVTYYSNTSAAAGADKVRPLSQLPITQVERQQYQKVIDQGLSDLKGVNDQVAANTPKPGSEQYPIGALALLLTVVVIGGYLAFVYVMSFREYREVIHERFGPSTDRPSTPASGDRT